MIIRQVTIVASPDASPNDVNTYTWKLGDDLIQLDIAITGLQAYLELRRDVLRTALAAKKPLDAPVL